MNRSRNLHKLYEVAFGAMREEARKFGITIKQVVKDNNYSGKVLRRGTPGAFGFVPRPLSSAKRNRSGFGTPGNSRDRRFARRHPQHFSCLPAEREALAA